METGREWEVMLATRAYILRFVDCGTGLPAEDSHDLVTNAVPGIPALDHLADRKSAHRVANLDPWPVSALVCDPAAHRRVDRKIFIVDDELSVTAARYRSGSDSEACRPRGAILPAPQHNSPIHHR